MSSRKPAKSKVKRRRRVPKQEPYTGGGTWYPPGMMPGGRYWGGKSPESW